MDPTKAPSRPIPKESRFTCVQFPACVRPTAESTARAITMLGGDKRVSSAFCDPDRFLELRFRPDPDSFAHPAFGDRRNMPALLLRVEVRPGGHTDATVAGVVDATYRFRGLCDFQYVARQQQTEVVEDVGLCIPPALFSRRDNPLQYLFKQNTRAAELAAEGVSKRLPRIFQVALSEFDGRPLPSEPPRAMQPLSADEEAFVPVLREFFAAKPIWSSGALCEEFLRRNKALPATQAAWDSMTKRLRPVASRIGIYFTAGPWRTMFVKFGFDPRTHPEAAAFQTIDVRLLSGPPGSRKPSIKRGIVEHPRRKRDTTLGFDIGAAATEEDGTDQRQAGTDPINVYKLRCHPGGNSRLYCIADVRNKWISEVVRTYAADHYTPLAGWLTKNAVMLIRETMKKMIAVLAAGGTPEDAEQAAVHLDELRKKDRHKDSVRRGSRGPRKRKESTAAVAAGVTPAAADEDDGVDDGDGTRSSEEEDEDETGRRRGDDDDVYAIFDGDDDDDDDDDGEEEDGGI